jgi:6-O-methylguanine DNA methyltransferase, DNA binding domain
MPRTDEAAAFFHAVYSAVQEIPPGKVTSYGHIAKLIGTRMFKQKSLYAFSKGFPSRLYLSAVVPERFSWFFF